MLDSMVYAIGTIGFIIGFLAGQMVLLRLLKGRSRDDLLADKSLHWTYGVFNWLIAALGAYAGVQIYQFYFA
ncbi:MAG: hypothetical protein ACPGRX_08765 [Bdellovibrionales bacterium]